MAELGADAPRYHDEVGAFARELGVDVIVGVGELRRRYGPGRLGADAAAASRARPRESSRPGDTVLVKASRAVGLEVVADALAGVAARVTRVLIAGLVALIVSILIGPRFIAFLRANEFGQHIREEGPEHHFAKQGTPTMGGLLILLRGDDRLPADDALPPAGADGALRDARLRRDRLPRRLHQAHARALARAQAAAGRCCCSPA